MLINTEVDSDDDASVCVHTAFSGLNGTDMCNGDIVEDIDLGYGRGLLLLFFSC